VSRAVTYTAFFRFDPEENASSTESRRDGDHRALEGGRPAGVSSGGLTAKPAIKRVTRIDFATTFAVSLAERQPSTAVRR
jgi:hypothetical protein